MHIRAHLSSLLAAALLVGGSACASSPDVPEEQSKESPNYKSTQPPSETQESTEENEEGAASKSSSTSTGANAGKAAGSKEIPKATGPVAHVDGEPIPAATFNKEMQKVAKTGKFPTSTARTGMATGVPEEAVKSIAGAVGYRTRIGNPSEDGPWRKTFRSSGQRATGLWELTC